VNSWPYGYRHAITPDIRAAYNGPQQRCTACQCSTGRCEDDSIYRDGIGPLCEGCAKRSREAALIVDLR